MSRHCLCRTVILVWAGLAGAGACDKAPPAERATSLADKPESTATVVTPASDGANWKHGAGPALLVQGETRDDAIVLLPAEGDSGVATDMRSLQTQAGQVVLFGRGGARFTAHLGEAPHESDASCRVWPLVDIHGDGTASAWAVGFVGGQVAPLALDSVEALTSRDSMALAAEASRLASAVTASTSPSFQGLRFAAHDIRRFDASPGVQAIVAHLIRKINQEASPEEEQTLLIAERDSGVTSGPYHLVYADRTHGLEEELAAPEVMAGVRIAGHSALIVARDNDAGVVYVIIERTKPRQWTVRWTSGVTRCG